MGIQTSFCCANNYIEKQDMMIGKTVYDEIRYSFKKTESDGPYSNNSEKLTNHYSTERNEPYLTENNCKIKEFIETSIKESDLSINSQIIDSNLHENHEINCTSSKLMNKLILKTIHNKDSQKYLEIEINTHGIVNSPRGKNDGYTYFGCENEKEKIEIDYAILPHDITEEDTQKIRGIHFCIYFDESQGNFFLRDFGNGFGTYIKLSTEYYLNDNTMIHIGNSFILVNKSKKNDNSLFLSVFNSNGQNMKVNLAPSNKMYRLGRSHESEISIEDKLLSRFHCFIKYDNFKGWYLKDGFIIHEVESFVYKESTNGTWIYVKDDTQITNNLVFKSIKTVFQCQLLV